MHELAQRAGILFQESGDPDHGGSPTVWEEVAFGPRNLALQPGRGRRAHVVRGRGAEHRRASSSAIRAGCPAARRSSSLWPAVLALGPRYLVLDEPTSQLDPLGTQLVGEALAEAARATGIGVLIVEHKTDLLARMCDEVW